jgi:hypothetical protein
MTKLTTQDKSSQSLKMALLGISFALSLAACNNSSGSTTNGGGQSNGDASSLQIIAPKIVYSKSSADSTGYVLIKNPTASAVSNLHYSLTQAVGGGSAVTLEPSSAANCALIAAHSQCSVKLVVPSGSIAGSQGFSAGNKSSQSKQVQATAGAVSTIGIEQAAYNNTLSGADGITLSYYHTVITGVPYIMVSGLVASSKAGSFNNIVLTDNKGNPLPNQQLISGSISSTQGSTFSLLLPVPTTSGASQTIRVQTQQVASDGSVTVVSTSSNSSTLTTSSKIGIADMLPDAVYLTSTHPEQVITLTNTGDVNAQLQTLVASSSNIVVAFASATLGSGATTTATLKLKNPAVTASGGSITLSYNNGNEEVKNSAAVGENVNPTPSPTPTPTPSPKPVPPTPGLSTSLSPDNNFYTTTAIGTVSRTMTIHNSGNTPETNFVFTFPTDGFSIASSGSTSDDCTVDANNNKVTNSLNNGSECKLTVTYAKASQVAQNSGDISIAYNYSGSTPTPTPAKHAVNYEVTQSQAILHLSPTSVTYSSIVNNMAESSSVILTVTNTGDLAATGLNSLISPNPSNLFMITNAGPNCGNGNTLPAGESCTLTTRFGPTTTSQVTNATGTLTVSNGGGTASTASTLIGTVLTAQSANISQESFSGQNFAGGTGANTPNSFQIEQASGTPYPYVSVTITNSATVPATKFFISDGSGGSYWTLGGNCGTSPIGITLGANGSGSNSCTATFTMTSAALNAPAGAQNLDLTNYSLTWNDQAHPTTPTTQGLSGTAYVNVYTPATIAVTTNPSSNISIATGESFSMTATLSDGYNESAQTIHASTTTAGISFVNNDCALNSQNSYTCTINAVAANDAALASGQTITLNNSITPSMAPSPSTVNFNITIVQIALPQTGQLYCVPGTSYTTTCGAGYQSAAGTDGYGLNTASGIYIPYGVAWAYNGTSATIPPSRFTAGPDTSCEVTDTLTGLIWLIDPSVASGAAVAWATALSTADAGTWCGQPAGTWRLPNVNELSSLLNLGAGDGSQSIAAWLITQGFTNVQATAYWSSTSLAPITNNAWIVNMNDGPANNTDKGNPVNYVWPVRGSTTPPAQIPQTGQIITIPSGCTPESPESAGCITSPTGSDGQLQKGTVGTNVAGRFVAGTDSGGSPCVTGQETNKDKQTSLMWIKNPSTTPADDWSAALTSAAGTNYCGYSDWRLPNRRELLSLVNYGQTNQATWLISQGFGANVQADSYWSSTSYAPGTSLAWFVNMNVGHVDIDGKSNPYYVWPVRGGH